MTVYDFDPHVSCAVWFQDSDVGVAKERGIYGGGAQNIDGRGKFKVSGFSHRQGRGDVGNVSPVCERPVVPLAGSSAHPTCVVDNGLEQRYTARTLIFVEPCSSVPQEEGSGVPLLNCRVYLLGDTRWCLCGGCIHEINQIWLQNCLVVAGNASVSREEKYARYVQVVGTRSGRPPRTAMVRS